MPLRLLNVDLDAVNAVKLALQIFIFVILPTGMNLDEIVATHITCHVQTHILYATFVVTCIWQQNGRTFLRLD